MKDVHENSDILVSTDGSIVKNWKMHPTTQAQTRQSRPSKLIMKTRLEIGETSHCEANHHSQGVTEYSD